MKRFVGLMIPLIIIGALVIGGIALVSGASIDALDPAGQIAAQQRKVLILTLFLSSLVVVPVFTMLIVFAIRYRASNHRAEYRPEWGENKLLEGLWWGIPIAIIGVLGVVTVVTSHSLDPYKPIASDKSTLEVQVVAMQWKWLFIYPQYDVATLNYLPVEVDRPIHFTLTADAPMSAFWIPKLGSQIYAMNGMQSELNLIANKTGSFTGYTTNINGEGYADMTFTLRSYSTDDFNAWRRQANAVPAQIDSQTYETLSQPTVDTKLRTYRLAEEDLFATIVHERMDHSHEQMKTGEGH